MFLLKIMKQQGTSTKVADTTTQKKYLKILILLILVIP